MNDAARMNVTMFRGDRAPDRRKTAELPALRTKTSDAFTPSPRDLDAFNSKAMDVLMDMYCGHGRADGGVPGGR